jgi:hypothetical protein
MENIYNKISKIQKEIGKLKKDKQNPFFKSNYVDINGILEQLNPLLEKEGLVLIQPLSNVEGRPALKTILTDGTDKIEETTLLPDLQDPQKMGSCITYVRRYSIQSLFCLVTEDDDAESAVGRKNTEKAF